MDRAQRRDECLLWAILDRAKWLTLGQCCAASEVGLEPKLPDTAQRSNGWKEPFDRF